MSSILTIIPLDKAGARTLLKAQAPASGNWQTLRVISARDGEIACTTVPPGTEASISHIYPTDAGDFTAEVTQHTERPYS